jgi:hypothetical protein
VPEFRNSKLIPRLASGLDRGSSSYERHADQIFRFLVLSVTASSSFGLELRSWIVDLSIKLEL